MIRHQAERHETDDGAFRGFRHRREKPEVVGGMTEDLRLAVTAIDDVLRDASRGGYEEVSA